MTSAAAIVPAVFLFGFLAGRVGRTTPTDAAQSGVLDSAADQIREKAATDVSREELQRVAIEAMLKKLGDKYATYVAADDYTRFQQLLDGRYTGVGLWLARHVDGAIEVVSVLPASPAAAAGLEVGDRVVSVGGRAVSGQAVSDVVSALRGAAGTEVSLSVRSGADTHELELRRADVDTADVTHDEPASGVTRIQVKAFTRGVGRQVRDLVAQLAARRTSGIVLDLRGNPGGLLIEAVEVASAFLDGGVVVSYAGRGVEPQSFSAAGRGDTTTSLAVLVDGGTASAAEVVAGALQDRGRAVVVGSPSYGKGSVQQPFRLPDGSAVELTVATYRTPSGRSLDGTGIAPDVDVLATADGKVALRRAVDILAGIVADAGTDRG